MEVRTFDTFHKSILGAFPPPSLLTFPGVGIDISDESVKYLSLARAGGKFTVSSFGERKIPEGVVSGAEIQDQGQLINILTSLRRDLSLGAARFSLPEEKAYLFQTKIPTRVTAKQARNILEFQLEEHVPVPAGEAVFDYEIIGPHRGGDEEHIDVGVSVYARETVEAYRSVCLGAGLFPVSFEVEAQAIARSVIHQGDMGSYLIIDFGRSRTGLAIINNGVLHFTATLEVGGQALSDAIASKLSMNKDEVREFKNVHGILTKAEGGQELLNELLGIVTSFKEEIQRHIVFWNTRKDDFDNEYEKIEAVILSGGNANLAGLPEYLSTNLLLPVYRANVWGNAFSFESVIPEIDYNQSLGYATAVGLALHRGA